MSSLIPGLNKAHDIATAQVQHYEKAISKAKSGTGDASALATLRERKKAVESVRSVIAAAAAVEPA